MPNPLTILVCAEGESWRELLSRARKTKGKAILILSDSEQQVSQSLVESKKFIKACEKLKSRVTIALRSKSFAQRFF